MDNFKDNILFKTNQHKIILFTNFLKGFLFVWIPFIALVFVLLDFWIYIKIIISLIFILLIFYYFYFFWKKSTFSITNKQLFLDVRNWIFSNFHMSIYFENIRDIAYSKNNILHYIFNYWTFFARSSAWAEWDFLATNIPKIEYIYKIINYIHMLPVKEREELTSLKKEKNETETIEKIIEKEKKVLLNIKWIKEVVLLDNNDRKFIFENEEDKNHWVFETIRRKVVFCFTHDSFFRDADAPIVLKLWNKVIFPAVSFHEINRSSTVSSSPWIKVHEHLSKKFNNLAENDATVLVWFDL